MLNLDVTVEKTIRGLETETLNYRVVIKLDIKRKGLRNIDARIY